MNPTDFEKWCATGPELERKIYNLFSATNNGWYPAWSDFKARTDEILQIAIQAAVQAEREACAAICDEAENEAEDDGLVGNAANVCAERIRARGTPKGAAEADCG